MWLCEKNKRRFVPKGMNYSVSAVNSGLVWFSLGAVGVKDLKVGKEF